MHTKFLKNNAWMKTLKILIPALIVTIQLYAQPGGGGPPGGGKPVPLSGIEYLIISGGILGAYKLFKRKFKTDK